MVTRGFISIHSTPSALCPHIEWAIGGVLGVPTPLEWTSQPAERGTYRAELAWRGKIGTAAAITSALKRMIRVRFEVTEDASAGSEALRYAFTPELGIFQATVGIHGDVMIHEDRLKAAMLAASRGGTPLATAIDDLLGTAWDHELDIFRHAGDGAPVRWLHRVS